MDKIFTHPIIRGTPHQTLLPQGTALVLEGGGTRGFYTAGVFEAFMDEGVMFPYIVGVSAGAANALTYVAGQRGRNRLIVEHYVADPRYVSKRNLLRHRSLFGYDFIFKTIPEEHLFFDHENFGATDIRFLAGATDCETGEAVWFEKDTLAPGFEAVIASCSVPLIAKIVDYQGRKLVDGGVASPIPIEKSVADGNTFHVIVLTRNAGYEKPEFKYRRTLKAFYKKYPRLMDVILRRHEIYGRQIALCEQLEREGKAIIIRPLKPLAVDRSATDTAKLLALYDEGHEEGRAAMAVLRQHFSGNQRELK